MVIGVVVVVGWSSVVVGVVVVVGWSSVDWFTYMDAMNSVLH